jgi:hypothetical protein
MIVGKWGIVTAMTLIAAPGALSAQPANADAQEPREVRLSIGNGETATARVVDGGFVILPREPGNVPAEVPAGAVRFTMGAAGGMTMLRVDNGTGRPFEYRAEIVLGGRRARTSTCTVLPKVQGWETWREPIDRIEISRPELGDAAKPRMRCR